MKMAIAIMQNRRERTMPKYINLGKQLVRLYRLNLTWSAEDVIKEFLLSAETIDVIHCKDCKHYDGRPCGIVDWYNTSDDFCSRAERRTE